MNYELKLGTLNSTPPDVTRGTNAPFRIAVLGDFSARANGGAIEVGDDLAKRKAQKVDFDNLDDVLTRFAPTLHLQVGASDGTVELSPTCIDDLHPDELYVNLPLFEELSDLRVQLDNSSTFAGAAAEIKSWLEDGDVQISDKPKRKKSKSTAVPAEGKLSDFAKLVDRPLSDSPDETPAADLIKSVIAPYVVDADDSEQEALVATVDQALSGAMRSIIHHPDFQALESAWRSLDFLVRRLETDAQLQIVVFDISAEEVAADLSACETLEDSGLYKLLVEQPASDDYQGLYSVIVGNYTFQQTPPHAELLGRMAKIAAHAQAPFIAAIAPECVDTKVEDLNPMVRDAWDTLRALPEARLLGLGTPRFMLRMPYGAKTDPISEFEFEEFSANSGLRSMLWANPSILVATLLAQTYTQHGTKMTLGKVMSIGDMPFHYYTDSDGDQVPLPCTERLLTERKSAHVVAQSFMPVLSIRGRPEVRLGSFQSLAGLELAGAWLGADALKAIAAGEAPPPPPEVVEEDVPAAQDDDSDNDDSDGDLDALLDGLGDDSSDDSGGDDDLDALLAGIDDDDSAGDDDSGDDDLDALLAGLDDDDSGGDDDEEMDPELAALLADL